MIGRCYHLPEVRRKHQRPVRKVLSELQGSAIPENLIGFFRVLAVSFVQHQTLVQCRSTAAALNALNNYS